MPESDLPNEIGGQWSDVFDWPIIGLQSILTPDGKILTYGTDQFGTARRRPRLRRLGSSDEYPLHAAEQDADRYVLLGSDRRSLYRARFSLPAAMQDPWATPTWVSTTSTCSTTAT